MPINIDRSMEHVNRFMYLTEHARTYNFANMKYGERLRLARERAGLSQQQLADAVGIKQPSVQHLEDVRNDSAGSIHTVTFARTCGVSADWLADETGDMVPNFGYPISVIDRRKSGTYIVQSSL